MANTEIGDVFSVNLDNEYCRYFQYVISDLTQLNSDVIRVFKKEYRAEMNIPLPEIITDEVEFYAHCVTKAGQKLVCWKKVGNISDVGDVHNILFRGTRDSGKKRGAESIKVSYNWYIWRVNDRNFTKVGKLIGANRKAEIGLVVNPFDIVHRIKTGKYDFVYPEINEE